MSRKDYYIKPSIKYGFDKTVIFIFPTIAIQPWRYRYINLGVIEFCWLTFYISYGTWSNKKWKEVKE